MYIESILRKRSFHPPKKTQNLARLQSLNNTKCCPRDAHADGTDGTDENATRLCRTMGMRHNLV